MTITTVDILAVSPDGTGILFNNNADEKLQSAVATLGFSNAWTIEVGLAAFDIDMGTIQFILEMKASGGDENRIQMFINTDKGDIEVSTFDSSGSALKSFRWPDALRSSGSTHPEGTEHASLMLRWDGTTLDLFRNGANMSGVRVKDVDNSGTMSDSPSRAVAVGNSIAGAQGIDAAIHTVTIWDKALDDLEIETLANHGFFGIDVRVNQGKYVSVANLVHWFRLGQPVGSIGVGGSLVTDEVASGGVDLEAALVGITEADLDGRALSRGFGQCLDFNGTTKVLENTAAQSIGIVNEFTISLWYRSDDVNGGSGPTRNLFTVIGATGDTIEVRSNFNRPTVILKDGSGTVFRNINADLALFEGNSDEWIHGTFTWNGTADATGGIAMYRNGTVEQVGALSEVTPSIAGSQSDSNRTTRIGGAGLAVSPTGTTANGNIAHVAVWNTVLPAVAIQHIFVNRFSGDLNVDGGVYSQAANLKHWWKPGEDINDFGRDYVISGKINLTTGAGFATTDIAGETALLTISGGIPFSDNNS